MTHEEEERALTGDSHIEYLKRERRSAAMGFPITIALLGFAIYGVWELEASWEMALLGISMPLLFLAGVTFSYISLGRRIQKERDDVA